jgi:hypothetical protein
MSRMMNAYRRQHTLSNEGSKVVHQLMRATSKGVAYVLDGRVITNKLLCSLFCFLLRASQFQHDTR